MMPFYEDTHPSVEKKHIELLKNLTVYEHLQKTLTMTSWLMWLSKKAIAKAHPEWSTKDLDLFFVKTYYGEELARKLRDYLDGRQ